MEGDVIFKYAERQRVCDLISKGFNRIGSQGDTVSIEVSYVNLAISDNHGEWRRSRANYKFPH